MATNLEMQAMNLVNEDILDCPEVSDEQKYQELLDSRKNRKAGENLFNFLERQIKDQMRTAIGQPLQDVSEVVLKKVASKNINSTLTKYKPAPLSRGLPMSKKVLRDRARSPDGRLAEGPEEEEGMGFDANKFSCLSKEVQAALTALNTGSSTKMSLLKMFVVKCDENISTFSRMRRCLELSDYQEADRLLFVLEESNFTILRDLQQEISEGINIIQNVGQLSEQLMREKFEYEAEIKNLKAQDQQRGRQGRSASPTNRQRERSTSGNAKAAHDSAMVYDLRKQIQALSTDNEKLRNTMREMVDDYTSQLDARDMAIKRLESNEIIQQNEVSMLVYKENEALKQENRMLRDKVGILDEDLSRANAFRGLEGDNRALQDEIERLNRSLIEKDRQMERQIADSKNEWAEIYGSQRMQVEQLQRDNQKLAQENERLVHKADANERGGGSKTQGKNSLAVEKELGEAQKRLKKREMECQALWETFKDLRTESEDGQMLMEMGQVMEVFAKRALDTKARRKLEVEGEP